MPSLQCVAPITLYRKGGHQIGKKFRSDVVACGKCPPCLRKRQHGWIFRLQQEEKVSSSSAFITLTYEDQFLPFNDSGHMTLVTKDHQLFIKRLRKNIKEHFPEEIEKPIKYYAIGEYGDEKHRPHYHSIMFNLPTSYLDHPQLLEKDWQKGRTQIDPCNQKTIAYVTGYMKKTMYTEERDPLDDRKPEFSMMSKGLGANYLTQNRVKYYQQQLNPFLVVENGQKAPIPRYYKDQIFSKQQKEIINAKTEKHMQENPSWTDEKERHDIVSHQFHLQERKNNIKKRTL